LSFSLKEHRHGQESPRCSKARRKARHNETCNSQTGRQDGAQSRAQSGPESCCSTRSVIRRIFAGGASGHGRHGQDGEDDHARAGHRSVHDIINAALEGTAKVRRLQFEGEEQARAMGHKAARHAAEAGSPNALMAAGQSVSQEAVESAMRYWGQMFELVVEVQKRLFTLMEGQMAGVPGVKEAKAAMAMMPDMRQAQNVVNALQGVVSSGGNAFESMQKVMGDFAKFMPGQRR
jgi:hypothetical protein